MNQFKERLKIVQAVEDVYNQEGQTFEIRDKIALAVYSALTGLEVKTEQEKRERQKFIMDINSFIYYYDEIKPTMVEILSEEKRKKMEILMNKFEKKYREQKQGSELTSEK